ncbi:B-cell receptor CD22-like [Chanos chanos]|uniref:B-cell receptor CD22-like n=1 Tax=Chanos chanos TaxID=29144 RepID=A0A6J2VWN7_CHACN|nr:B-cell receptor CD22-like [Chanos chanos]
MILISICRAAFSCSISVRGLHKSISVQELGGWRNGSLGPGTYGQNWGVTYIPDSICVLKGSSVTMFCSYKYPTGDTVETVFWTKHEVGEPSDLSKDIDYKGKFHDLGDKQNNCTMKLINVTQTHSRRYRFRFITNKDRWIGQPGVTLSVTDLQVETPERVMEGDTVTLKCNTTCSLSNTSTFIWYKNGHVLTSKTMKNNELSLQSVSSEDRGSYMCAVQGHENLPSPAVTLNVVHAPEKTTVSVSPSGEIVEGSSVNLTCSSDANPPANYTWFKKNGTVTIGKEETYRINKISSEDSGEYQCKSSNQHGHQFSNSVSLNVFYPPRNTTVSVSPSGEIVEGSSVNLTCSSDANPPQINYTWYKESLTSPVGYGQRYIINNIQSSNSGLYYCEAQNKHGSQKTTANCLYNDEPPRGLSDDTTSHDPDTQDDPANQDDSASQDGELYANVSFSEPESSRRVSNIFDDDIYANM